MLSNDAKRRFSSLGLFALPILAVKAAGVLMGGSAPNVSGASAAVTDPATTATTPAVSKVEWTVDQRTAAEHVRQLAGMPFGPAPMLYTAVAAAPQPKPLEPAPEPEKPRDPEIPAFALHAVMAAPSGNKALINGRLYQVGQKIAGTTWTLHELNVEQRMVVLAEENSTRTVTLNVQQKN